MSRCLTLILGVNGLGEAALVTLLFRMLTELADIDRVLSHGFSATLPAPSFLRKSLI